MADEHFHEIVMPFVTVTSKGGPHEDGAYTAGWEMGALDAELQHSAPAQVRRLIHAANAPQADLIGMRNGYSVEIKQIDDTWSEMFLAKVTEGEKLRG